jgi:very-short-patch-repair endonuclease
MPSKGEERVSKALKLFGNHTVLREYVIGEKLRLDFFLKSLRIGIEVQGIQHNEFSGFFYDSAEAFKAAKQRDQRKAELCYTLGITLIHLEYDEVMRSKSAEELLGLIHERIKEARPKEEEDW